jgi:NCS1 family nucleobase:cation symporter-1
VIQQKEKFQIRNWELVSINPNNRNWTWANYFNLWAVNTQSIIGFSLVASLYILYDLNSFAVLTGCLIAGLLVYFFANLIGKTSQNSGLSFPVILRLSMGFNGARYVGMLRGLVGIFMFGVQTFFISKSLGYLIRIFIYEIDTQILYNEILLFFFFGMNLIDWVSLIITFFLQFYLFTNGQIVNRKFISFSAIFVYIGLSVFLIIIVSENYNELVNSLKLSTNTKNFIAKENIFPIISITGTMFAYFSILLVNYGDFSRYAKNYKEMNKGNLSLILNLIIFSFFALLITLGSDIILTKKGITVHQLLTNPLDIIDIINNNFLTAISLIFIIVSSTSSNLISNYIPSQNTLINFLPNSLTLKKCGLLIIVLGLLVSIFWLSILSQNGILLTVDTFIAFYGPIFGIIIADFYLVKKQKINHKELFYPTETTEYIYSNGWNYKAIYSLIIGFIFAASTIWNESLVSFQTYGWIIGAFVSYVIYYFINNE